MGLYLSFSFLLDFAYPDKPVSDVLLDFFASSFFLRIVFIWLLKLYHIWKIRYLILISVSIIWSVTFSSSVEWKIECIYVFGGPYLPFLNIVWGKSLSFWWSVPSFLIAFLQSYFFDLFSLVFCKFIVSDKKEKVKHKF